MTFVFLFCFFIFSLVWSNSPPPHTHTQHHAYLTSFLHFRLHLQKYLYLHLIFYESYFEYWKSFILNITDQYFLAVFLRLRSSLQPWPEVHREPNHISVASPSLLFSCCIVVLFTSETNTIFIHDSSQSADKINICFLLMKSMFLKWVALFCARPQTTRSR